MTTHGGKREGAGRKPTGKRGKALVLYLDADLFAALERIKADEETANQAAVRLLRARLLETEKTD